MRWSSTDVAPEECADEEEDDGDRGGGAVSFTFSHGYFDLEFGHG